MDQDKNSLTGDGKNVKKKKYQRKSLTTSHRQINAQPVSEQQPTWKPHPSSATAVFTEEFDGTWHGTSLWPAWISCSNFVSLQFSCSTPA